MKTLTKTQKLCLALLIFIIAGIIGWLWEFLFVEIDHGFDHLYIKGGNFLPWINIYAYGSLIILLITHALPKKPFIIFTISAIICAILEFIAGVLVFYLFDGARYWDYSNVWFGFGNLGGFTCPAAAITFGLLALLLVYVILPACRRFVQCINSRLLLKILIILLAIILFDEVFNLIRQHLGLPFAHDFYLRHGWIYAIILS